MDEASSEPPWPSGLAVVALAAAATVDAACQAGVWTTAVGLRGLEVALLCAAGAQEALAAALGRLSARKRKGMAERLALLNAPPQIACEKGRMGSWLFVGARHPCLRRAPTQRPQAVARS